MGLYDALPSAKDEQRGDGEAAGKKEGWVGTGLFAPANLAAKRAGKNSWLLEHVAVCDSLRQQAAVSRSLGASVRARRTGLAGPHCC